MATVQVDHMRVLMLFLDGVGIGRDDRENNPFFAANFPALRSLCHGVIPTLESSGSESQKSTFLPIDATLGVEGLPQSGTGQTALFTGVNGARVIGKHFGPHPYSTLKPLLRERNIFRQLRERGKTSCFANAFPQRFFDYVSHRRSRLTVTTFSCLESSIPLLQSEDLENGRGISADITNTGWADLGYPHIPVIEPEEAGIRLVGLTREFDFVLFEYWKTDHAGHAQNMADAIEALRRFDRMLAGILTSINTRDTLLLITSDHGNVEDLSVKTHTRNPVPLLLFGHRHQEVAARFREDGFEGGNLTRVTPLLVEILTGRIATPGNS